VDAEKEEETTPLVKSSQEILHSTVRLVSKLPLDLPTFDSVASRWSASTGSAFDDNDWFSYEKVLNMFPEPPEGMPNLDRSNDWENSNSLSNPPFSMSFPNTSSSSVATITPTAASDPPVNPLMLKAVPNPRIVAAVHQALRAGCAYTQPQGSIVIRNRRAYPRGLVKGSIHTSSIRTTGAASALRRRSSSFTSSQSQSPPKRIANLEALVWPWRHQTPEDIERIERERLEREREYQIEQQRERELKQFEMDFGYNPRYRGKRMYQREVDPSGLELVRLKKERRKK
jgi:hypothetical protein